MHSTPKKSTDKPRFCGKKGRSGPPKGNHNALRHGLATGKLPTYLRYIEHRCNGLRRNLEDQLLSVSGAVTEKNAGVIWACVKRYREVLLRERRMRQIQEGCQEWFDHTEKVATAAEKLVKLLDRLPLDRDSKENVLDALYSRVVPNGDEQ